MTAYTWATLQTAVQTAFAQSNATPPDFVTLFPDATSYAEGRIARDLVLLNTRRTDTSLSTTPGTRILPGLSSMSVPIVVPEYLALEVSGTFVPFIRTSLDLINFTWPQQSVTQAPTAADMSARMWTLLEDQHIIIAPTPDAVYTVAITGLFVQTPLSASITNSTTNAFTTGAFSATLTIVDANMPLSLVNGQKITLGSTVTVGGLTLSGSYAVNNVFYPMYQITASSAATSSVTGGGTVNITYPGNATSYIATYYGDLMFCAVMIWMSGGYVRNYGAQADEAPHAMSWETQYAKLLDGCIAEEARRRGLTPNDLRAKRALAAPAAPGVAAA
jgi:hypothetical protein